MLALHPPKTTSPKFWGPVFVGCLSSKASVLDLVAKAMLVLPATEIQVWLMVTFNIFQLTGCT